MAYLVGAVLLVALAVADGLVDHEAALRRLAVPDVLRAALLVEDRVALPHVLRRRRRLVVALALLALRLLQPLRHVHRHRGAVLLEGRKQKQTLPVTPFSPPLVMSLSFPSEHSLRRQCISSFKISSIVDPPIKH